MPYRLAPAALVRRASLSCTLLALAGCLGLDQVPQRADDVGIDAGPPADAGSELPYPPDPPPEGCEGDQTSCEESASCDDDCTENVCGDGHRNFTSEGCDDGNSDPFDGCKSCRGFDLVYSTFTDIRAIELAGQDIYAASSTLLMRRPLGEQSSWAVAHGFADDVRALTVSSSGLCATSSGDDAPPELGKWNLAGELLWKVELNAPATCLLDGDGDVWTVGDGFVAKLAADDGRPRFPALTEPGGPYYAAARLDAQGALEVLRYGPVDGSLKIMHVSSSGVHDAGSDVTLERTLDDSTQVAAQFREDGSLVLNLTVEMKQGSHWEGEAYSRAGKRLWHTDLADSSQLTFPSATFVLAQGAPALVLGSGSSYQLAVLRSDGARSFVLESVPSIFDLAQDPSSLAVSVAYSYELTFVATMALADFRE